MRLPSIPDTLKRGVGKRVMLLLLIAAALPALVTGGLAWFEVGRGVEQDAADALRGSSKAYGIELFSRLERASSAINEIANGEKPVGRSVAEAHPFLFRQFNAVGLQRQDGSVSQLQGEPMRPVDPGKIRQPYLDTGGVQFLIDGHDGSARLLLLKKVLSPGGVADLLVFQLRAAEFWRPLDNRLYGTEQCVYAADGSRLFCTDRFSPLPAAWTDQALGQKRGAFDISEEGGEEWLAASWQLFLKGAFGAPSVDIVAYQPKDLALRSGADFSRVFWPALALVVVIVATLTLKTVGQSLTPLNQLTTAARQLTAGNLASRVRVRTGDEFEALADAFNDMAGRLGSQIAALEAMSEIDKLILSKVRLEDVAGNVLKNVKALTNAEAVAVIARDPVVPYKGIMLSSWQEQFCEDEVALPGEVGHQWCQPRQVVLDEVRDEVAPYKDRFLSFGQHYAVLIPVVLDDDLKGMLLLGSRRDIDMRAGNLRRCIDLAGRLAVALASVEREEALYRKAHYDDLTGLPNRQLLMDRLQQRLVIARRENRPGALLFMDLDRFKEINDVHGHSVGDVVLSQAAERIVNEVREADTVARLGGDEFVIVLPNVDGDEQIRATATRLLDRLSESFSAGGVDHYLAASIGIVLFPDDGDSVETLLKNADSAMYRAKEAGRARFEFFSEALNAASQRKIALERDLRTAFRREELELFYQPQFDLSTGIISGAEALLRWTHPEQGPVSPAEFIPLAEDSSLIVDIGRWVIRKACTDLRTILDLGLHPGPVSINVSAAQLRDPEFVNDVLGALSVDNIHPGYLQLEVTETTVAQNKDTAIDILNALRAHGVRVAIDDFGTGYSSLSYLQQMPFDVIKIDMSFVQLIGAGDPSDNICRTIIRMAHELGKQVIAEGVESVEQSRFLADNQCDFVQGYFHSEPMPPGEFLAFIRKQDFHTQRRKALEIVG